LLTFLLFFQCVNSTDEKKISKARTQEIAKKRSPIKSNKPLKALSSDRKKVISPQDSLFKLVKLSNDTTLLSGLINKAADVNYVDNKGYYPLRVAKQRSDSLGRALMINKLLELGAVDIDSLVVRFFKFCEEGKIDSIQKMLNNGFNINWKQRYYEETEEGGGCGCLCAKTAIFIASKNQNISLVKYLIAQGAEVNLNDGALQPLEPAIVSKNWELAEFLIENGASKDVSKCYWWGWDGLSSAPSYYHTLNFRDTVTLNFLLKHGFHYPKPKYFGWGSTPIDNAASNGDTLILKRLITLTKNKDEFDKALCFTKNIDVAKILIKNGAELNYIYSWSGEGNSGEVISPLYTAIYNGNIDLVKLYLKNGADVNILHDKYNGKKLRMPSYYKIGYPLLIAVEQGYKEIVNLLLENGAKVNFAVSRLYYNDDRKDLRNDRKNEFWQSPLIAAISHNDKSIVEVLLSKGANVIVEGDTITNYSFKQGIEKEILNMLNQHLEK
jgi:ankyrin repeat protein